MDKNISNPKVTVLMPVYNSEKYLKESIESILNQTFTNFEFLIINDGSTDKSKEIINSYDDSRIRLINNEENIGITRSLNNGLFISKGEYIARMDADDISLPKRLKIQVQFMDEHPEIGIVGSWIKTFGEQTKQIIRTYPAKNEKIKTVLLFKNPIAHPSIMMRKNLLNTYNLKYDEDYQYVEDYELWTRAIKHFPITNIEQVLLLYRINNKGITQTKTNEQQINSTKIKINQLLNLNITLNEKELLVYKTNYKPNNYKEENFLNEKGSLLLKLVKENNKIKYYREPEFSKTISRIWFNTCAINMDPAFSLWKIFFKFPFQKDWIFRDYRFILKCFLNRTFKNIKKIIKKILNFFSKISEYFLDKKAIKDMGKVEIRSNNEKGITIVILSFNRIKSLKKLLSSLLKQKLENINTEIIICNNFNKINLKKTKFTKIGCLLRQFSNLKILNSSHNWRTEVRYSLALIAKYETIIFIDDDIFLKDNNFIQYIYDKFKTLNDIDLLSCWNTIWTEYNNDKYFKFASVNFTQPNDSKKLVETDTCGMGICIFNKKILYRQRVFSKLPKHPYADDMGFPILLNLEMGGKNYYLPSFGKLAFHKNSNKFALNKVKEHYIDLYSYYKELYKEGYIPVIERSVKSKKYIENKTTKKHLW